MRISELAGSMLIFTAISTVFTNPAFAVDDALSLPSDIIDIRVVDGNVSYFNTTLIGVPPGFNVTNATYLGWSVDSRTPISRSPAAHEVRLFSSLNPPREFANEKWDMLNYVLNHKKGVVSDVQQAIWYFVDVDGNYTPSRPVAWEIVNETLRRGEGYIPLQGQAVAVICYPLIYSHQPDVQITIIELGGSTKAEFPYALLVLPIILVPLAVLVIWVYRKKG